MPKQLVFVDDSGNPGFKGTSSSSVLVISGILITDSKVTSQINVEINKFPNSLGWQELHEFKFRKASKNIKLQFLELINKYDFSIYAVYIDKTNYPELFQFSNDEKLYNWMVKELLLIMPLNKAVVIIDGKYGKKYQLRFKSYIRKSLNTNSKKIENFKAKDSARDNLVQ